MRTMKAVALNVVMLLVCSYTVPTVSIVVPFFGLTKYRLRIREGNPKKELQWRLQVVFLCC